MQIRKGDLVCRKGGYPRWTGVVSGFDFWRGDDVFPDQTVARIKIERRCWKLMDVRLLKVVRKKGK
jgi:hypothetical protein